MGPHRTVSAEAGFLGTMQHGPKQRALPRRQRPHTTAREGGLGHRAKMGGYKQALRQRDKHITGAVAAPNYQRLWPPSVATAQNCGLATRSRAQRSRGPTVSGSAASASGQRATVAALTGFSCACHAKKGAVGSGGAGCSTQGAKRPRSGRRTQRAGGGQRHSAAATTGGAHTSIRQCAHPPGGQRQRWQLGRQAH
jgi:hypothetical protein